MQAAEINWRPLGELFVEQGLINDEELEEALTEQRETQARLGQILVSRGLVSGPELTRVLVDQLGRSLEKDGESRLRTFDRGQRESARAEQPTLTAVEAPNRNGSEAADVHETEPASTPSAFEAALAEERESLEAALNERRAALQATLAKAPAPPQPERQPQSDVPPSTPATPAPLATPAPADDAEDIATAAREQMEALNARLTALEASFADERTKHRQALDELEAERSGRRRVIQELDQARSQARLETSELRSSLEKLRAELTRLDETTSWFEYWSGSATLPTVETEPRSTGTRADPL